MGALISDLWFVCFKDLSFIWYKCSLFTLPSNVVFTSDGALLSSLSSVFFQNYKIGHLLCRSRNPDFLLDILQRQGTSQAMPWLADLVESSEGSFNVLPVQCLCEFLLNSPITNRDEVEEPESDAMNSKKLKQKQLLLHLQDLLQNPKSDFRACTETLEVRFTFVHCPTA